MDEKLNNSNLNGISVIMPTYNQACFIRNAIRSVFAQTFSNWELIIIDDGSTDNTEEFIHDYISESKVLYHKNLENKGIGYSINLALRMAKYNYIAYLPSDDIYFTNHLQVIMTEFQKNENVVLVTTGVRCGIKDSLMCNKIPTITGLPSKLWTQLVQTAHKKTQDRWTERKEWISEDLYRLFWNKLTSKGLFVNTSIVTCQWTLHPYQHHKILSEEFGGNINRYRSYYHVKEPLKVKISEHKFVDEEKQYSSFRIIHYKKKRGLKILLVGELSYNPERICALEEDGHKLYGLWTPTPSYSFSNIGPLPFGHINDIPYDNWEEEIQRIKPDIIYGLLNSCAVPIAHEILMKCKDIPFVWHFKEGPFLCQSNGNWKRLIDLLSLSDGVIFLNKEIKTWYEQYIPSPEMSMIMDGDLPKINYFNDNFSPKLSEMDGEIHTVIPGRMVGLSSSDILELSENRIHIHLYTESYESKWNDLIQKYIKLSPNYFHIHEHCDASNWTKEFSKYDAGWLHLIQSENYGNMDHANWNDLNIPARVSTMMVAGIPCIQKDNTGHIVAMQSCLLEIGCGIFYSSINDLAVQLYNRELMERLQENVMNNRKKFAFDSHVPELVKFFKKVIKRKKEKVAYV